MKYSDVYGGIPIGREPLSADATDDERRLATLGVQFENGDVPREGVAFLLNLARDLMARLREANEALVEAGFATMTADDIAEATFSTPEEQAQAANGVRDLFARAYAAVMKREADAEKARREERR